jgi:peptide/nickel transport system substrate-binding protein
VEIRIGRVSGIAILSWVILLVMLVVAGCAGPANENDADPPNGATAPAETPAETPVDEPAEARGGTLRMSAFPIAQTDPAFISSDPEVLIAAHVYDYLIDIDAGNEIQPRLATDWTESDDGLTYTFTLAEGVTFHDGSEFTAQDVVWTYDRLRNTEGLPTEDLYRGIESVEATGDLEVTFTLAQPNPFFLYDLSDNHALIIRDGTEDATDFNGTGPFIVTDYQPENRLVMEANENYFIEGQPALQAVEIIFFNELTTAADALRGGQIDLASGLSPDLYDDLRGRDGLVGQHVETNQFAAIRLRTDIAPGDDPAVMLALRTATNRGALFELVQQGYGAVGRDTPVGPLFDTYYSDEHELPDGDPEAARQILEDAGYPDGLDVELNLLDTLNYPDMAVVLQSQWAEAGIIATINILPESIFYGEGRWLDVPLGITGWGHRPYPQFYMEVMLACDAIWNETRFCDEEFDELIATAGSSLDEAERVEAYAEMQRILVERGPFIVPFFFAEHAVISDNFEGFQLHPFSGRTDLRPVRFVE